MSGASSAPRVAIAHDWLVRYAGSERVVEQLLVAFPGSCLHTTILDVRRMPASLHAARTSFLDRMPGSRRHHEWYLPLMPLAWTLRHSLRGVDAVVASSHACALGVRVDPGIPLVCYCHTPMRYAWDFDAEQERFPRAVRTGARLAMAAFRAWDRRASRRVTQFIANSDAVARRIASHYGRDSIVVHPPVRTDYFTPEGDRGSRFLYVGRLVGYKRPDLVIDAFRDLPYELDIVGDGPRRTVLEEAAPANVRFLGGVSDGQLRDLYRSARALVYPVEEDFGIAMAEAQACGTPVIGLASGGARDIVEDGVTGWLLPRQDIGEIRAAVSRAATHHLAHDAIRGRAVRFSEERFRTEIRQAVVAVTKSQRMPAA